MLLLLGACDGSDGGSPTDDRDPPTDETGTSSTGSTADTGPPAPVENACALDPANGLRAWCTTTTPTTGDFRVEITRADGTDLRTFRPDPALGEGVLVWGLEPLTTWSWRILDEGAGVELSGALQTLSLPLELRGITVDVTVSDPTSQLDAFLFSPTCPSGFAIIADRDGDVIWYQDLHVGTASGGVVNSIAWSEDGTVLAHTNRSTVRELDLAGNVRLDLVRGVAFEDYVHHDLTRKAGFTYDLRARQGVVGADDVVFDGVYVFDGSGALVDELDVEGLWPYSVQPHMEDGYWAGNFPGAVDFSHANSVHVDAAGDILVSFRHLSAFAKFQGGPGLDGFGTLLWTAVGDPSSAVWSEQDFDVTGVGDSDFQGQHDVNVLSDGSVALFDNGFPLGQTARAVRYALDEEGRTLTLLDAWETSENCPVLGGVRELPGGNLLVTCDSSGTVYEFRSGQVDPVWQAGISCDIFFLAQVPRVIPVSRQ